MSYAKFGSGGSDVYVFADVDGYLVCCACFLHGDGSGPDWRTPTHGPVFVRWDPLRPLPSLTYGEMIAHLSEHSDAGHHVPDLTYSRLQREQREAIAYEMEQ